MNVSAAQADFASALSVFRDHVEITLREAIDTVQLPSSQLRDAMRYATLNGGKRLRPSLVYATGRAFGASLASLDNAAAAVECIHCCSLVHDDLPAMDDDDLRRGKPTCHIAFDEATAILAGDALQILAFDLLSSDKNIEIPPKNQLKMIQVLAQHAGASGMIGGQSLDLLAEGNVISVEALEDIHLLKTGALIRASVLTGALGAGCNDQTILASLDKFAICIGLAFQLQDDLLDAIGDDKKLGKRTQQDSKHFKASYPLIASIDRTKIRIQALLSEALLALRSLSLDTGLLVAFCSYLEKREY
ncbi:MAG: hypothetical protein A3E84_04995 [Gammaproteobacteria bacterium RIFCSPHIGHO2_12_FULL_42_13]|nr:MAG: hypothetical protein A3E84_04995 [Gammaproteobacteria bacterium RIFCSPHIGHO2_12_FULL_42_13]